MQDGLEESLSELERKLGWRLPEEYCRYHREGQYWADFFTPEEALEELGDWEHAPTLPLGGDGLGNLYVLAPDGAVSFWDHERPEQPLVPIQASFATFMLEGRREYRRLMQA